MTTRRRNKTDDRIIFHFDQHYLQLHPDLTLEEANALYDGIVRACRENPTLVPLFCKWAVPPKVLL